MLEIACKDCGKKTLYKNWDEYMKKQLNSIPYCPKCGGPCDGVAEQS